MEQIGAKGMQIGEAAVAGHHGNLIMNLGQARANDIWKLAQILQGRVREKYGIELEPEVQLVGKF